MLKIINTLGYFILITFSLILLLVFIIIILNKLKTPKKDKNWNYDQKILSYATFEKNNENIIKIHNIRNNLYKTTKDYKVRYYDKTININNLKTLDYIIEPFKGFPGLAHTFISFGFEDKTYISISIEIRREIGQKYSPLKGLFPHYEIIYVIADEKDVINLRANHREHNVYLYPLNIKKENIIKLFKDMLTHANKLKDKPKFYNTITNSCSINIAREIIKFSEHKFYIYHPYILLPEYSDRIFLKHDLIKTEIKDRKELQNYFNININAKKYQNDESFSQKIRLK